MTTFSKPGAKQHGAQTPTRPLSKPTSPPYAETLLIFPSSSGNGLFPPSPLRRQRAGATLTSSPAPQPSTTRRPSCGTTARISSTAPRTHGATKSPSTSSATPSRASPMHYRKAQPTDLPRRSKAPHTFTMRRTRPSQMSHWALVSTETR
jgi:hypothetical protein